MCAVWDYFLPAYNCPLKEKIGIDPILGDNGKWLCGVRTLLQRPGCVIYSFGCAKFVTSCSPEQKEVPFQPAMKVAKLALQQRTQLVFPGRMVCSFGRAFDLHS